MIPIPIMKAHEMIAKIYPDLIIEILSVGLLLDEMDRLSNIPPLRGEYTEPEEEFRIVDR